MLGTRTAAAAMAGVVMLGAPLAASAQGVQEVTDSFFARDRNTSVSERPRPDYQALGLRAGGFMVYPRLQGEVDFNDNIYAGPKGTEVDDTVFHIRPQVAIQSNWNQHSLGAYARAAFNEYSKNDSESTDEYAVGANGVLDIVRGSNLYAGVDYQSLTEPRIAPTAPTAAASPIEYDLFQINAGGVREVNRIRLSARVDYSNFDYQNGRQRNGALLYQDDRDREMITGTARIEYAVSPATAVFVAARYNDRNYKTAVASDGYNKDSNGYAVTAGVNFDITAVVRGELEAGYLEQDPSDPRLQTISSAAFAGRVEWFPTQLTTVTLNAGRSVEEGTLARAGGFLSTSGGIAIDHELMRNVILNAQLSYTEDKYKLDRRDKRTAASLGGQYLLNRWAAFNLTYSYYKQNSEGALSTRDYTVNRFLLGLTLQL